MTYQEKLKDPRWQKKRLQILERDGWTCQNCYDMESMLQIHHKYYKKGDPWEYPDNALITLCEECHNAEKQNRKIYEKSLLSVLKTRFLGESISELAIGIHEMPMCHTPEVVASVYGWAFSNEDIQKELIEKYFQQLKSTKLDATA